MVDQGVSNKVKCRVLDVDGGSRIMELRCGIVRNRKGHLSEMVMIYRDLGDRHLLEENLRFSERHLTQYFRKYSRCGVD